MLINDIKLNFDPKEGRTQQQFKDSSDINTVIKKYRMNGILSTGFQGQHVCNFGDFSNGPISFHEMKNVITKVTQEFMTLDPFIRDRFKNDPGELINFLNSNDPTDIEEARKLGFLAVEKPIPDSLLDVKGIGDTQADKKEQKNDNK